MDKKIKKILSLSAFVFLLGFVGAFLGKSFEHTKLGKTIEQKLGLDISEGKKQTAQNATCIQQGEKDNSALFVGCNGFF